MSTKQMIYLLLNQDFDCITKHEIRFSLLSSGGINRLHLRERLSLLARENPLATMYIRI